MPKLTSEAWSSVRKKIVPVYHKFRAKLPLKWRRHLMHIVRHRRLLHLERPRTFNEKLAWRMVYDRREILRPSCDKKAMKRLAQERAGNLVRIPATIWSGCDLGELESVVLPEHWVLKPNHRSGLVYFGQGPARVEELVVATSGWLDERNWTNMGEWAYGLAERTFVLEEFIGHPGQIPVDYKFQVFDEVVRVVEVYHGRFHEFHTYFFDREFSPLNVKYAVDDQPQDSLVEMPLNYEGMIGAAERIAAGFDHLRVDLYNIDGEIWFGEVTPYSASAGDVFEPSSFDRVLGSYWKLPRV